MSAFKVTTYWTRSVRRMKPVWCESSIRQTRLATTTLSSKSTTRRKTRRKSVFSVLLSQTETWGVGNTLLRLWSDEGKSRFNLSKKKTICSSYQRRTKLGESGQVVTVWEFLLLVSDTSSGQNVFLCVVSDGYCLDWSGIWSGWDDVWHMKHPNRRELK